MKGVRDFYTVDPLSMVRQCLSCKKKKCNNCLKDVPKELRAPSVKKRPT